MMNSGDPDYDDKVSRLEQKLVRLEKLRYLTTGTMVIALTVGFARLLVVVASGAGWALNARFDMESWPIIAIVAVAVVLSVVLVLAVGRRSAARRQP